MSHHAELQMIGHRYREAFGANLSPNFAAYISCRTERESTAALGYAALNAVSPALIDSGLAPQIKRARAEFS